MGKKSKFDEEAKADKNYEWIHRRAFDEALKNGVSGAVRDLQIYSRDWGFSVSSIKKKVIIWHGTDDQTIPVEVGRYLAEKIPDAEIHLISGAGHNLSFRYAREILQSAFSP